MGRSTGCFPPSRLPHRSRTRSYSPPKAPRGAFGQTTGPDPPAETVGGVTNLRPQHGRFSARLLGLFGDLCRLRAPAIEHALGPKLENFLAALAIAEYLLEEDVEHLTVQEAWRKIAPPGHWFRLLPNNPNVILSNDVAPANMAWVTVSDDMRHFTELRDYRRSFHEEGRRGRPKSQVKTGGRTKIDIEEAVAIRRMRLEGESDKEIIRRFWPEVDRYDSRAMNRARALISRRVERADLDRPL